MLRLGILNFRRKKNSQTKVIDKELRHHIISKLPARLGTTTATTFVESKQPFISDFHWGIKVQEQNQIQTIINILLNKDYLQQETNSTFSPKKLFATFNKHQSTEKNTVLIETRGKLINASHALLLASKTNTEVILAGQPLPIAHTLWLYKKIFKITLPQNLHIIVNGYLSSIGLRDYILNDLGANINIEWACYYGNTTTGYLKAPLNECNGFGTINGQNTDAFIHKGLLYLTREKHSHTINTEDRADEVDGRFYLKPKNELEAWVLNWEQENWQYLTGNTTMQDGIIYLQCREDDTHKAKQKLIFEIPTPMYHFLGFKEFQTKFNVLLNLHKPKYLSYHSTIKNYTASP
ncbi:hypothetical protein [uncultured Microscilla sp.]|uniref:hypothetical protein n=1 Tax=uncultured Microscilla sp. TaxID=432653 RepID=UPI0026098AEB|nr:hypothetical protein [uncultured Microscilla sp.]